MLRALIAVMLAAGLGALGYYFWSSVEAERTQAGTGTQPHPAQAMPARAVPIKEPPAAPASLSAAIVNTGTGAPVALPPEAQPAGGSATGTSGTMGTPGTRQLGLPIVNLRSSDILDTFGQQRGKGERQHEASDIMAPRGTPVVAVDDGVIKKLFTSEPGGLTIYQYDPTEQYAYYYAHLDRYADGVEEGQQVRRGTLIGYVGSTGNADPANPHLHFAILKLGPEKEWWRNTTAINPYSIFAGILAGRGTR